MDYTSIITSNGINWNIGEVKKCLSFTNLHQEIFKTDIPITNTCNFNSTIWNFNNINIIGKDPNTYKFDFSTINDPYRYYAKIIILNSLFLNGHTPPNSVYQIGRAHV